MVAYTNSEADFDALLAANKYVIVDFTADWCPPCRAIAPVYENLAAQHAAPGMLAFAKVNVDNVPAVASRFSISSIPTFLFFRDGRQFSIDLSAAGKSAGALGMVRGADARKLTAAAAALAQLAKEAAAAAAAAQSSADATEAPKDDGSTVSGGYALGTEGGGKRADWKMSLD